MPDGYAFAHDPKRCVKCYTCELACKQWKGIPAGTFKLRKVYETSCGTFPDVTRTFHSVACQHCPDAPCVPACPTGAIERRESDGIVVVEAAKCDGCRECVDACPFDVTDFRQRRSHAALRLVCGPTGYRQGSILRRSLPDRSAALLERFQHLDPMPGRTLAATCRGE